MTKIGAFRAAVDASAYSVRRAWGYCPTWLARLSVGYLVLAVTPAAQVLAVSWLAETSGGTPREFVPPLVVLTVLLGLGQAMTQNTNLIDQQAVARVIDHAVTHARPRTRYVVTPAAKLLVHTRRLLGGRAFDAILRTQFRTA